MHNKVKLRSDVVSFFALDPGIFMNGSPCKWNTLNETPMRSRDTENYHLPQNIQGHS